MPTIYIDPTGANGSGTELSPFNAWSAVTWTAGNSYLQKRGTTHAGTITVGTSGTAGSRIVIGAYGEGARPTIQGGVNEHGINLGTRSYVTVQGVRVVAGSGSARHGINGLATDALTAHGITIEDCEIEAPASSTGNGVQLRGAGEIIRNCDIHNCYQDGLFLTCSDVLLDALRIYDFDTARIDGDAVQFAGTHNHGTVTLRNLQVIGHTNSPIKQCVITAAGTGTFQILGGDYYGMVTGLSIAIAGAVIKGAKVHGGTSRGITCAANNITVTDCLIYDTPRGVSLDLSTGAGIYGNTIDASAEGVTASNGATTFTARNNFIDAPMVYTLSSTATATASSNRYATGSQYTVNVTTYGLAGWKTASGTDADAAEIAPQLSDSFRPLPGSPLIGAGTHLGYRRDADGKQRQNPPAIGAYDLATLKI